MDEDVTKVWFEEAKPRSSQEGELDHRRSRFTGAVPGCCKEGVIIININM